MTESTKTILIVAGVALVGYLVYKKVTNPSSQQRSPITNQGTGNSVAAQTQQGASGTVSWWNTISSIGSGVSNVAKTAENTYNSVYDYFGGNGAVTSQPNG
jgi:hypothetical protein